MARLPKIFSLERLKKMPRRLKSLKSPLQPKKPHNMTLNPKLNPLSQSHRNLKEKGALTF